MYGFILRIKWILFVSWNVCASIFFKVYFTYNSATKTNSKSFPVGTKLHWIWQIHGWLQYAPRPVFLRHSFSPLSNLSYQLFVWWVQFDDKIKQKFKKNNKKLPPSHQRMPEPQTSGKNVGLTQEQKGNIDFLCNASSWTFDSRHLGAGRLTSAYLLCEKQSLYSSW